MRQIVQATLDALTWPALAIGRDDRIFAANAGASTLIGADLVGRNYVTMLRQPAVLDVIEVTLQDGAPRSAQYFSNDGVKDTTFDLQTCRIEEARGEGGAADGGR